MPKEPDEHSLPQLEDLQAGLNAVVRQSLPSASLAFVLAYALFTVLHPFLLPDSARWPMTILAGSTLLIAIGIWQHVSRGRVKIEQAHFWAGVMLGLITINLVVHISLDPDPVLTANSALLIVAAGCLFLSLRWLISFVVINLGIWLWGALVLNPSADWPHFAHMVIVGVIISLLVHQVRLKTYQEYETLRQNDARLKSDLQHTTLRLEHRLRFEQILTSLSTRFLELSVQEIEQGIAQAMQAVGECLEVDHVCMCQVAGQPSALSLMHEWCGPGIAPRKPHLQNIPTSNMPWSWQHLQSDQFVQIARVSEMAENARADKTFFQLNGVRSFFAVSLATEKTAWGMLALATEHQEIDWSDETAHLLKVLGEIIVASLKRKEAEEEICDLNQRLEQASRLVGLGEMSAGFAHELQNGLGAILMFAKGAIRRNERGKLTIENSHECINDINEQAEQLNEILTMIKKFVKKQPADRVPVHLPELLKDAEILVRGKIRLAEVQLKMVSPEDFPSLQADPAQILLVLVNLINNAAQAMADMEEMDMEKRQVTVTLLNQNPDYVEVSIRDQGPGISPEKFDKIFEKFYTTKEEGLGLGLAFSRSYITQHDGELWCVSEPGQGCDFRFTLPLLEPLKDETHAPTAALTEVPEHTPKAQKS